MKWGKKICTYRFLVFFSFRSLRFEYRKKKIVRRVLYVINYVIEEHFLIHPKINYRTNARNIDVTLYFSKNELNLFNF